MNKTFTKSDSLEFRRLNAEKHGESSFGKVSKEYKCWSSMKIRCSCKKSKSYKDYGGRGIVIRKRWMKFENFLSDMGRAPSRNSSLERIDNNGNYTPSNCKWATRSEQQLNKRTTKLLVVNEVSCTIHQWQKKMGFGRMTIRNRLNLGWDIERAILTPVS